MTWETLLSLLIKVRTSFYAHKLTKDTISCRAVIRAKYFPIKTGADDDGIQRYFMTSFDIYKHINALIFHLNPLSYNWIIWKSTVYKLTLGWNPNGVDIT